MSVLKKKTSIVPFLFLGYAVIILIGSLLLSLPCASASGTRYNYIDCLFTSTSATCVTGLVPFDTGLSWSVFGQIVIMLLIQIGGLGFMTVVCILFIIMKQKISLHEQNMIIEAQGDIQRGKITSLILHIVTFTFIFELIGFLLLLIRFIPLFGGKGAYYALFTSISAFCNAGFDIFTTGSLTSFQTDPYVLTVICVLIVCGGLGFVVWADLFEHKFIFKRCNLHTKAVLLITFILIFLSAVVFFILEFTDIGVKGNFTHLSITDKIVNSLFLAITPRTAGFNSVNMTELSGSSQFITVILMFIGGSPCSTAGGVKTTTFLIVVASLISSANGKETRILRRRINVNSVKQSLAVILSYLLLINVSVVLIGIFDKGMLNEILFEVTSAICTVGLTLDYTVTLGAVSKIILIILMYVGRLGAFTLFELLFRNNKKEYVSYPEGRILVG